jgi:hypothetical protein
MQPIDPRPDVLMHAHPFIGRLCSSLREGLSRPYVLDEYFLASGFADDDSLRLS